MFLADKKSDCKVAMERALERYNQGLKLWQVFLKNAKVPQCVQTDVSSSTFDLENAKQQMKNYRDLFGGELDAKEIDCAKTIFDLERIFIKHSDFISDMESDAQSSLSKFQRSIGVF